MFILRLLLLFAFLTLSSCESADIPKYEEMSEFDLVMHNSLLPENEQIVCQDKRKEWIGDYFLQCCAYANAHNVMFDTNISQIAILMVDRDLIYKKFVIKESEFTHYTNIWKKKLLKFHNSFKW